MIKVFLDANIFFSASYSSKGGSFQILRLAEKNKISIFTSTLAIKEAERNLQRKASDEALYRFYNFLDDIDLKFIKVNRPLSKAKFGKITGEKDAPILAAALESKALFLVTLDRKHLLNIKTSKLGNLKVVTPGEFIEKYL